MRIRAFISLFLAIYFLAILISPADAIPLQASNYQNRYSDGVDSIPTGDLACIE